MPGQDDLIYLAEIDDKTGEFFDEFDRRIDDMEGSLDGSFAGLESGGIKAAAVMGVVGGAIGGITAKLVEMAFAGTQAFVGYVKEAAMFAARVETLGVALEVAGAHAGYSREEMQQFEESVKSQGITTSKARIALQQMAQADLELEEAAKLARVAQDAAVVAGVNSSEAFNRILYAITSLQPEILRTMNLTVNMQAEQERYAKEIGKTVGQLTASDRQQAMLNATMRAGKDIAGTYEAAMDTVGKKLTSLPRYFEEIQLAIGNAFQPALLVGVDYLTEKLKEIQKWLEENEESLMSMGLGLADFAMWLTSVAGKVGGFMTSIPTWIGDLGEAIARFLAQGTEVEDQIDANRENAMLHFKQLIVVITHWIDTAVRYIIEYVRLAADALTVVTTLFTDGFQAAMERVNRVEEHHLGNLEKIEQATRDNSIALATTLGLIERTTDATEDLGFEFDKAAADALALEEALDIANSRLEDFARTMEDQAADLAIKASRAVIESALKESWAREDMERSHQARLRAIMEQASSSKRNVAKRYAQDRINIERDYQRRIRDLQRDFEFQASELARARDAVGLLKLMRSHDKALSDAEVSRKDRLGDAKRAFQEEMKLMNDRIQEQLRKAEEAHRLQLEDYERMKARERQIQALHDKWAEEDRQTQYAKQLAALIIQMGSIEGITQEGLIELIGLWQKYFGDLTGAATKYMEQLNRVIRPGGSWPGGAPSSWGSDPTPQPRGPGVGQGGRVSQMMSVDSSLAERLYQNVTIPPIPRVPPSDMRQERKEIIVKVSGEGLEPYIQRQVASALLEIERNATGG